jgi:hypothetical protein
MCIALLRLCLSEKHARNRVETAAQSTIDMLVTEATPNLAYGSQWNPVYPRNTHSGLLHLSGVPSWNAIDNQFGDEKRYQQAIEMKRNIRGDSTLPLECRGLASDMLDFIIEKPRSFRCNAIVSFVVAFIMNIFGLISLLLHSHLAQAITPMAYGGVTFIVSMVWIGKDCARSAAIEHLRKEEKELQQTIEGTCVVGVTIEGERGRWIQKIPLQ